jgi:Ca2+:H+ antiporter
MAPPVRRLPRCAWLSKRQAGIIGFMSVDIGIEPLSKWVLWVPPAAFALTLLALLGLWPSAWVLLLLPALFAAVFAAVVHAEVVALRVGEPYGTLILAFAVTVIEVGLILSLMLQGAPGSAEIARNTLFGVIMIVCNGVVGLCIVLGSLKHSEMPYRRRASQSALAVLMALASLTLVLPVFTTSTAGPTFSTPQLLFAAVASLSLYGVFVFVQTVRHRDFFLPQGDSLLPHTARPSQATTWRSLVWLGLSLCAVVGLGKALAPTVEAVVASAKLPQAVVGVVVGLLVLLPETGAALRAAQNNRLQIGLNLALGSALASIGLTIPAVALVSIALDLPLVLGLAPKEMVLLAITFWVSSLTLITGRASLMMGAVHLVLFAAFVFLTLFP